MTFQNVVRQTDGQWALPSLLRVPPSTGAQHQTKPWPLKPLQASVSSQWWGNELLKDEDTHARTTFLLSSPVEEPYKPN